MDLQQTIFGPILNPRAGGAVDFIPDGALCCDDSGTITFIGARKDLAPSLASSRQRQSTGIILPPFLDAHIHIPQHPIRGHFMEGVEANPPEGRLLAGLNRNVFPAEAKCADVNPTEWIVEQFRRDTLAQGVVGGSAYMTVHPAATRIALLKLPSFWSVGLVLMNMNCPDYLRTNEATLERDVHELADWDEPLGGGRRGSRFILADRFAVAVDTPLRRRAAALARTRGIRMQTHLNEQVREKELVEKQLYPDAASYTDVYYRDGLLDHRAILAHCIHMREDEWELVRKTGSYVAHCPTSNTLLGSGIMPLNEVKSRGIEYAICTDVGASPTTSILAEMAQFLKVHAGRSTHATPSEALYRATLAPAKILDLDHRLGSLEIGKPMSFIEVETTAAPFTSADDAIARGLLDLHLDDALRPAFDGLATGMLDAGPELELLENDVRQTALRLEQKSIRVTLAGQQVV